MLAVSAASGADRPAEDTLAQHRQLFEQLRGALARHQRLDAQQLPDGFTDYPLYPYLELKDIANRYTRLPFTEIDSFLTRHEGSYLERRMRSQWLATLARKQRWNDYLRYYRADQAGRTHQCWYLESLHQNGQTELALVETTTLWMNASSLPHACDDAFKRWLSSGMRSEPLVWQRLVLALDHGNYRLARYLTTQLQGDYRTQGRHLLDVYRHPERLDALLDVIAAGPHAEHVLSLGLQRLARRDPETATTLWLKYRQRDLLGEQTSFEVRREIARQVIAGEANALAWLVKNDPNAEDSYLLEWRIRLALKAAEWPKVERWIALLPAEDASSPRWRYWMARALAQRPETAQSAEAIFEQLASERHFYGFLAADQLGHEYGFNHRPSAIIEPVAVAELPAIRRAREWLAIDDRPAARREWYIATRQLPRHQVQAAAQLARDWGWHSQAIRAAIQAEHWDDLELRFPLAHRETMISSAASRKIPAEWLYAVARQESAFAEDVRSGAGAVGLLQLMPATARQVARSLGRSYRYHDLLQPERNIELGSTYLSQLLEQFNGNRIVATAAYNAGPHRISRVLQRQQGSLEYDVWIENIPYHETRDYVQNVLAFAVIYGYRMGNSQPLVAAGEQLISP